MPAAAAIDETTTELDSIHELLAADEARRAKKAAKAPAGFDPAAVFLLSQGAINLFDPTGKEFHLRCKGCGADVLLWHHKKHFARHKASLASGAISKPTKGDNNVPKTIGPKEQQAREQREARATQAATVEVTQPPRKPRSQDAVATEDTKPQKAKPAVRAAESGSREDSVRISGKLIKAFIAEAKKLKLGKVTHATNDKTGYASIKVNDVLVGYCWFTSKADLRVEAAMSKTDMPDDDRVGPYKRSRTIQARTRIGDDKAGYDLAVSMFVCAARKVAA